MPPPGGGICGRLTQDLPLGYLQGGTQCVRPHRGCVCAAAVERTRQSRPETGIDLSHLQAKDLKPFKLFLSRSAADLERAVKPLLLFAEKLGPQLAQPPLPLNRQRLNVLRFAGRRLMSSHAGLRRPGGRCRCRIIWHFSKRNWQNYGRQGFPSREGRFHIETIKIHKLSSRKVTTYNDLH